MGQQHAPVAHATGFFVCGDPARAKQLLPFRPSICDKLSFPERVRVMTHTHEDDVESISLPPSKPFGPVDPPLSPEALLALQQACAPAGTLSFPQPEIIRTLRQHGYIEIVIGGIQATSKGLERLVRERKQQSQSHRS